MKKHIAFTAVFAAVVFIVLFAVLCYPGEFYINAPAGQKLYEFGVGDIKNTGDCEILPGNRIKTDYSGDPYIDFSGFSTTAECIAINLQWTDNGSDMLLYFYNDDTLVEESYVFVHPNAVIDGTTFVKIPEGTQYKSIRLKSKSSYIFNVIEFYEDCEAVKLDIPVSAKRYIFTALATIFAAVAAYFIDRKFKLSEKIYNKIFNARKKLSVFLLGSLGATLVPAVIELFIFKVINKNSSYGYFHLDRFAVMFAAAFLIFTFAFCIKTKIIIKSPEKVLLIIILCIGSALIIGSPSGHRSWDVNRHYEWSHNASYYGTSITSRADKLMYDMNWVAWPNFDRTQNAEHIATLNQMGKEYLGTADVDTSLPHRLSGTFMAVGRLFGATFYEQFLLGEFAVLLTYALLCYFAAKKLKSGKMIIAAIALLPTNLFMASNFSYDCWVIGFILLGTSYFYAQLQDPNKVFSFKDTAIMCVSFVLACLPKLLYLTVMLIPLMLRKKNFTKTDYKKHYTVCISSAVLLGVLLLFRAIWSINSGGDIRGGEVNSTEQFAFILNNVGDYLKILGGFLVKYLSVTQAYQYITNFAHTGYGVLAVVYVIMLIFTALTDKAECDKIHGANRLRIATILLFVGTAALMATAFYISFTEPGSNIILGCQPRYIIPLLFPLLLLIANPGVLKLADKPYYNTSLFGVLAVLTLCNTCAQIW